MYPSRSTGASGSASGSSTTSGSEGASPFDGSTTTRSGASVTPSLGQRHPGRLGDVVAPADRLGIHVERRREHLVDPGPVHLVDVRCVEVDGVAPLLVGAAEPLRAVSVEGVEALRERRVEDRAREERSGDFDQVEPVVGHDER